MRRGVESEEALGVCFRLRFYPGRVRGGGQRRRSQGCCLQDGCLQGCCLHGVQLFSPVAFSPWEPMLSDW